MTPEFGVLGPLEVRRDGDRLDLGAPTQRSVVARLLLASGCRPGATGRRPPWTAARAAEAGEVAVAEAAVAERLEDVEPLIWASLGHLARLHDVLGHRDEALALAATARELCLRNGGTWLAERCRAMSGPVLPI